MQQDNQTMSRRGLLFSLVVVALAAVLFISPNMFRSEAGNTGKGLHQKTESHVPGLENYDIRTDKGAYEKIAGFRASSGRDASNIADLRQNFVDGENALKTKVPTLKVEYNTDIKTPEVIAPDVKQGRSFLTNSSNQNRAEILRSFVKENENLIGVSDAQASALKVTADYTNPDNNLSFAHLEQFINDVPVFRGEVKAGFTKSGEMIRVINNLAPGLEYESLSSDFKNPLDAVRAAASSINVNSDSLDLNRNESASNELKVTFGTGDAATTAEKMYFPTEPGVARAAWRVLIWQPVNAFYVIVDAETGTMLWRKNITEDQSQAATYNVYTNSNAMINVADSPFPFTPGPLSPNGQQGGAIARTNVTKIGNEAPYTFNNLGWITDGGTVTDGNAVQAGIDRDGVNGVDANSEAVNAGRNFTYSYNPFNPNTNTGDSPVPSPQTYPTSIFQQGTVTQMFYIVNSYHDELYRLGFTEQARNYQNDNFGRGGLGADRVSAEGQDSSGTNNANFAAGADGVRGRMQMYLWTAPAPDIDGNLDADVVIHELTHGTSNRLHGNGSGLSSNMSRGMGEGWSDFYAHCLLSEPTDPINAIYSLGAYDTYGPNFTVNAYYAIRRFPKAVIGFTGGPNNRPHNPLTFADVDATQQNLNDGAYSAAFVGTADQVHNAGEVWSSALWEVRAKLVTRLGWAVGNRKTLQLVTDGMKLAPLGPTFLQERDAIVAAAQASSAAPDAAADVADVWAGFALRGMGFSAVVTTAGMGAGTARVTEAFDSPNLLQTPTITVSDATGDNDGFPEPGEPVTIAIPLTNSTGNSAVGTTLQIVGGNSADYGTIANGQTVSRSIAYTVPANTPCGSAITLTFNVTSSLGATSFTRTFNIGVPSVTFTENFDGVTAPAFPAGWTAVSVSGGVNFVNSTLASDTAPNSAYAVNPATVGGGTDLTSPSIAVTASAATVSFRHRFDTEAGWDGGVLEISIGAGAFQDIITAGGSFIENGYTGALGAGVNNPLANRNAWNGLSNGFITSVVRLPAAAAGQNIRLKWRFGSDDNTVGTGANPGWYVDTIRLAGNYTCVFNPVVNKPRADFDGDGRTDISVFRPTDGNWYLNRSTAGFTAVNWGLNGDKLAPGDFDGDGKADLSVYRAGAWYILQSSNNTFRGVGFGLAGDIPVAADYDNDDKADIALFRPSNGVWYIQNSSNGSTSFISWGQNGDVVTPGDFDGDGKTDQAIYRNGAWYLNRSTAGVFIIGFGLSGDLPVVADYDGDGKDDIALFRPSNGVWYIINSSNGSNSFISWGLNGDVPAPGDYDGDGKYDQAIFRNGDWYVLRSTGGFLGFNFGLTGDQPVPKAYVP